MVILGKQRAERQRRESASRKVFTHKELLI
jgi:hypothetical protein